MTKREAFKIKPGIYTIYWKSGDSSLAAIGMLHNGESWFAPVNWTAEQQAGIASVNWRWVASVEPVKGCF